MTKKPPKSKQNEAYWQAREEAEKQYILNQLASDDEFNKILEDRFNRTLSELEDKITADLARLSKNNKISYQEAQQAVRTADIKQLGAEAKTIVAKAHATGDPSLEAEVAARLRLYNATMRINRLEMIKAKIGQEMVVLGIDVNQDVLNKLTDDYQAEIRRQAGILSDSVASPNALRTKTALQHVYAQTNSATFSNRIWHNTDVLKAKLDMELSNVVLTGKNVQDVAREIRPLVNKNVTESRYVAERLARTESSRIQNEAKIDSFKRNGYDYCRWHAEPKACTECAKIARADNGWGQGVYKVSDVPYLPVHPNCRCSLSAYWVDDKPVSGALNGALDGNSSRGKEHANRFYNELKNSNRDELTKTISESSGLTQNTVSVALAHVLDSKYDLLYNDKIVKMNFVPDYDMAESFRRLRSGTPEKHDIIMLNHESLEADYMDNKSMNYTQAHALANAKYNYSKALEKWKESRS